MAANSWENVTFVSYGIKCITFIRQLCELLVGESPNRESLDPSRTGGFHLNVDSRAGHLDFEASLILASRGRGLQEKTNGAAHWRSQRTGKSGFIKCLLAVSVISLTLAYIISSCLHSISSVPKVRAASRSLAEGGSDKDVCHSWPEGESPEETPGDKEEAREGDLQEGSLPAATGGSQVLSGQQDEPSGPLQSPQYGWGYRQMHPQLLGRVTGLLLSIEQLAIEGRALFRVLSPSQAVELCEQLVVVAAIELSALACVPDALQPLRSEVAEKFARMLNMMLSNDATFRALGGMRLRKRFGRLKALVERVGGAPPESEMSTIDRETMETWVDAGMYAVTQALAELRNLSHPHERRQPSPQVMQKSLTVLRAIHGTRKTQLLRDRILRRWLVTCHSAVGASLLFTRRETVELPRRSEQPQMGLLQQVHDAVIAAGGTRVETTVTTSGLEPVPPSHHLTVTSPFYFGGAHAHPQDVQQHLLGPPAGYLPVPSPAEFPPSGMPPQQTLDPNQLTTPLQPQLPGQTSQQRLSSSAGLAEAVRTAAPSQIPQQPLQGAPSQWEQLGARPRQQAAPVERLQAESLGWGYRQMPAEWRARLTELLELMRTAATTCGSLLHSLPPAPAVLLPMHLSALAAVSISALAYIPTDLQPLRAAVGASYSQLLEEVLTRQPMRSAAASRRLTERILCLQVALERLSGEPPYAAMDTDEYAKRTCIHYRVCKYAFRQVLSLFEGLRPSQKPSYGRHVNVGPALRATGVMVSVLKMNLLVDAEMRDWFVRQASNLRYPLFTRADLDKASPRARMTTRIVVNRLQLLLVKAGVNPIELEKGESPFEREPESSRAAVGEHASVGVSHTPSKESQQVQPVLPAPPDVRLPSEPEQRPSQSPPTFAVSPQAPAQPAPLVWSFVPAPLFDVPQSVRTWYWEEQGHTEQRLAPGSFGSPCVWSSGGSSGTTAEGVPGSWGDEGHQGSSGGAGGELGLTDLAARVSQWKLSDSEEDD
ncbi:hypothetical protein Emed_001371 [Eimeria media]